MRFKLAAIKFSLGIWISCSQMGALWRPVMLENKRSENLGGKENHGFIFVSDHFQCNFYINNVLKSYTILKHTFKLFYIPIYLTSKQNYLIFKKENILPLQHNDYKSKLL